MRDVIWSGPIIGGSGYSTVARDYIYWLTKLTELNVKLDFVYYSNDNPREYLPQDTIDYFYKYKHSVGLDSKKYKDSIYVNHITPNIAYTRPNFAKNVLYSIWETDKLPTGTAEKCDQFDLILTGSEFSKFAFLNSGVKSPIEVIPHIVVSEELPESEDIANTVKDKFVFLSIMEWHIGKGYDVLINGFVEAFKDREDVILLLKTNSFTNPTGLKQEVVDYIKKAKNGNQYPSILPICYPLHPNKILSLYRYANCYVSASRREGFSLTAAKAIVEGIPVIAADHGGHREFLNYDNAVLVPSWFTEITNVERERSIYRGQQWVDMDYDIFKQSLIAVEEEWRRPSDEQKLAYLEEVFKVRKQLSPVQIISKLTNILSNL